MPGEDALDDEAPYGSSEGSEDNEEQLPESPIARNSNITLISTGDNLPSHTNLTESELD